MKKKDYLQSLQENIRLDLVDSQVFQEDVDAKYTSEERLHWARNITMAWPSNRLDLKNHVCSKMWLNIHPEACEKLSKHLDVI